MKMRIGLGAILLASACQQEIATTQGAIINGEVAAAGQFPAVGALVFDFGGGFFAQYCTGTLIAPNLVLSAAHCVDPAISGISLEDTAASTRVGFNQVNVNNGPQGDGIFAEVEQIFMNNDFNVNLLDAGNDISILVLKDPIDTIDPIPVNRDSAFAFIGDTFTAVGYGVSDAVNQGGSGIQRFTSFELQDTDGELTFYGFGEDDGVCFGDSGGPDLIEVNGEVRVFGIHSFVFDGSTCLDGAAAQRTDSQVAFIDPIVEDFGIAPVADGDDNDEGRCSVAPASSGASVGAWWLLALGGLLLRRRRS